MYDIIFIEGNKKHLAEKDHLKLRNEILKGFENKNILVLQSEDKNLFIPEAKVYIGFSQGTRYFHKLQDRKGIKISIGGASGKHAILFKHKDDKTSKRDLTPSSLAAHFTITNKTKQSINKLINKSL